MKNNLKKVISLFLTVIMFIVPFSMLGCEKEQPEYLDFDYFEMDTYIKIRLGRSAGGVGYLSDDYLRSVADECDKILQKLDLYLSSHNEKSQLYSLNSSIEMMIGVDSDLLSTLKTAEKLSAMTDGAYDYTLGPLTELWNINGGGPVPKEEDISEALSHTGRDKFVFDADNITKTDKKAKIDLGGIGKGMATQVILDYLATTDVTYGIVSLGGNIGVYGAKPEYNSYKIGVRDPDDANGVIGYMYVSSGFISVSGDYERYFEVDGKRYHHILDSTTGRPADSGVRSVAVHSSNGSAADALSTALFVLGVDKSLELYEKGELDFEAIFITNDGKIVTTPGITDSDFLLTSENYVYSK